MTKVLVLALDGMLESGLSITLDVLRMANRVAEHARRAPPFVVRAAAMGRSSVVTAGGYRREVDGNVAAGPWPDVVVVPGLEVTSAEELDALLAGEGTRRAASWLAEAHGRGAHVLASCSATFLVARAGLLDGGAATTSWYFAPHFRRLFPAVELREDAMVVPEGRVVTAGAAFAHVDLMLWLVRHVAGPSVADSCARLLVVDDRRSQSRYLAVGQLAAGSPEIRRAERFLRANLGRQIKLGEVARAAGASPRTLARRFEEALGMSPMRFVRRLRVERAGHLLETTRDSVEEIARLVGYDDPVALRRLLRKELGRTARELRAGHRDGL